MAAAVSRSRRNERRKALFDGDDFLQAASKFYTAQLMEPSSDAAKRMGAVACEYVVLDELNKGVRLRGLSEADKQTRRSQAFADARRALRGRGETTDAIAALRDVQAFDPDNDRARDLIEALKASDWGPAVVVAVGAMACRSAAAALPALSTRQRRGLPRQQSRCFARARASRSIHPCCGRRQLDWFAP